MFLPAPAAYFPLRGGKYDTNPALLPLQTDLGNGNTDNRVFQFDTEWPRFWENKQACRRERFSKYLTQTPAFDADLQKAVTDFFVTRLCAEYPAYFSTDATADVLDCRLTGERILLTGEAQGPPYQSAWDALACQVCEDVAVVRVGAKGGEETDETVALHLCSPSHWRAEDKIGRGFITTHAPVPHMDKTRRAAPALLRGVMERGPFVRFTWGIEFSNRLNLHPDAPPGFEPAEWNLRDFDPVSGPFPFLRVERQVLWPLRHAGAFVFCIRVYHRQITDLSASQKEVLASALRSMTTESRHYKGVFGTADTIVDWLEAPLPPKYGGF